MYLNIGTMLFGIRKEKGRGDTMKIYQVTYTVDEFMDGRMQEDIQLFSTLENAFIYCERMYNKAKSDFEFVKSAQVYIADFEDDEWTSTYLGIKEVELDVGIQLLTNKVDETY